MRVPPVKHCQTSKEIGLYVLGKLKMLYNKNYLY